VDGEISISGALETTLGYHDAMGFTLGTLEEWRAGAACDAYDDAGTYVEDGGGGDDGGGGGASDEDELEDDQAEDVVGDDAGTTVGTVLTTVVLPLLSLPAPVE
jgi:hypothetical protein